MIAGIGRAGLSVSDTAELLRLTHHNSEFTALICPLHSLDLDPVTQLWHVVERGDSHCVFFSHVMPSSRCGQNP